MTDLEIANLSGYALDLAVASAAETPPPQRERWGAPSPGGWWNAGSAAWLPRPMLNNPGFVVLELLDLLESWQQHAAIEDLGRGRGDERFLVMCGGLADAVFAHGPTLPMALARAVLMASERRNNLQEAGHGIA